MRRMIALMLAALLVTPTMAALPQGARAPDFVTKGSIGGKDFQVHLKQQLRKGPVVLYFFPKAFTEGCTLETKAFSDAMPEFRKAGAQVIGLSTDNLGTLHKFSVEACRSAFPVAQATPSIVKGFDVALKARPELTSRTSYVIGRDGRIVMVLDEMKWNEHVPKALAAVRALKR